MFLHLFSLLCRACVVISHLSVQWTQRHDIRSIHRHPSVSLHHIWLQWKCDAFMVLHWENACAQWRFLMKSETCWECLTLLTHDYKSSQINKTVSIRKALGRQRIKSVLNLMKLKKKKKNHVEKITFVGCTNEISKLWLHFKKYYPGSKLD